MTIEQLRTDFGQPKIYPNRSNPSKLSVLGIIFFMMGAPNLYAFMQRRAEMTPYSGSGMPRYALVVLLAMVIAGIVELSFI